MSIESIEEARELLVVANKAIEEARRLLIHESEGVPFTKRDYANATRLAMQSAGCNDRVIGLIDVSLAKANKNVDSGAEEGC